MKHSYYVWHDLNQAAWDGKANCDTPFIASRAWKALHMRRKITLDSQQQADLLANTRYGESSNRAIRKSRVYWPGVNGTEAIIGTSHAKLRSTQQRCLGPINIAALISTVSNDQFATLGSQFWPLRTITSLTVQSLSASPISGNSLTDQTPTFIYNTNICQFGRLLACSIHCICVQNRCSFLNFPGQSEIQASQ